MKEPFIITANHLGRQQQFEAQLLVTGYTYRFRVIIDALEVFFERDEEGSYRAVMPAFYTHIEAKKIDSGLLQSIAVSIESMLK